MINKGVYVVGFFQDLKKQMGELSKRRVQIEIQSGASQIFALNLKKATMIEGDSPGVVTFGKNLNYYFMGIDRDRSHSRSAGKTAAGTIIGTVLLPGVGTVVGAAVGAKKKDTSVAELDLVNIESKQPVTLVIKCDPTKMKELSNFPLSSYKEEVETKQSFSAADELLKFKGLLDADIITQEEFNAKKKELLEL